MFIYLVEQFDQFDFKKIRSEFGPQFHHNMVRKQGINVLKFC